MDIFIKVARRYYERLRSQIPTESPAREAIDKATRIDHAVEGVLFEGYNIPCDEDQAHPSRNSETILPRDCPRHRASPKARPTRLTGRRRRRGQGPRALTNIVDAQSQTLPTCFPSLVTTTMQPLWKPAQPQSEQRHLIPPDRSSLSAPAFWENYLLRIALGQRSICPDMESSPWMTEQVGINRSDGASPQMKGKKFRPAIRQRKAASFCRCH